MFWEKYDYHHLKHAVLEGLSNNANYSTQNILGLPATYLDEEIFYDDAPFLKDAPFLSTFIANPNHIGCHTFGDKHEEVFKGTQEIEKDLIRICAEEIFGGGQGQQDGYVASGGTEANIEALWIYRNYFMREYGAALNQIAVVFSEDTHYSVPKGINLLQIQGIILKVDENKRSILENDLETKIPEACKQGVRYFIIVQNLSTTMFGSVDDIMRITEFFSLHHLNFKLHVDAAFGGFIYPFTNPDSPYTFRNRHISSIAIDGHKMLQAPYGTGVFLVRKNLMPYVCTDEARYIPGKDYTLCGSRSGANAVCVWMILRMHGSTGWSVKMHRLLDKTLYICNELYSAGIEFYRNRFVNIIAIKSKYVSPVLAKKYFLVADAYDRDPKWYKIVVMPHVKQGVIDRFLHDIRNEVMHRSV